MRMRSGHGVSHAFSTFFAIRSLNFSLFKIRTTVKSMTPPQDKAALSGGGVKLFTVVRILNKEKFILLIKASDFLSKPHSQAFSDKIVGPLPYIIELYYHNLLIFDSYITYIIII